MRQEYISLQASTVMPMNGLASFKRGGDRTSSELGRFPLGVPLSAGTIDL
ncbi:hypothetical protein MY1884_009209 [Beauveria asiatica]